LRDVGGVSYGVLVELTARRWWSLLQRCCSSQRNDVATLLELATEQCCSALLQLATQRRCNSLQRCGNNAGTLCAACNVATCCAACNVTTRYAACKAATLRDVRCNSRHGNAVAMAGGAWLLCNDGSCRRHLNFFKNFYFTS